MVKSVFLYCKKMVIDNGQKKYYCYCRTFVRQKGEHIMTEQEKEIIEMIRNCPDREYALLMAIKIFTLFAEQPSASQ